MMEPLMVYTAEPPSSAWPARWPLALGFAALAVFVGTLGVWGVQARIAGAVISLGMIQVESNRQFIQHPTGGVVGEILAKNGDVVEAGDVVVRFDDRRAKSELAIVESRLFKVVARRARLEAERDGTDTLSIPPLLVEAAAGWPEVAALFVGQERLIEAPGALSQEAGRLSERTAQSENRVAESDRDWTPCATKRHGRWETARQQASYHPVPIDVNRVAEMLTESTRLLGEVGDLVATLARLWPDRRAEHQAAATKRLSSRSHLVLGKARKARTQGRVDVPASSGKAVWAGRMQLRRDLPSFGSSAMMGFTSLEVHVA